MPNCTDRGWRVEVRTATPDPRVPVPAGGRLLGFAHQLDDGRWRVATTDGRTVTLDTRVAAVLSLLAMTDATDPEPEPGTIAELRREADRQAVELGRTVARLAHARAEAGSETYERPADPEAGNRLRNTGARFGGVLENGDLDYDNPAAGS